MSSPNTSFGKWFEQKQHRNGEHGGAAGAIVDNFERETTPMEKAQMAWSQTSTKMSSFFDQWTRGDQQTRPGDIETGGEQTATGHMDGEANVEGTAESSSLIQRMWSTVGQSQEEGDTCGLTGWVWS